MSGFKPGPPLLGATLGERPEDEPFQGISIKGGFLHDATLSTLEKEAKGQGLEGSQCCIRKRDNVEEVRQRFG